MTSLTQADYEYLQAAAKQDPAETAKYEKLWRLIEERFARKPMRWTDIDGMSKVLFEVCCNRAGLAMEKIPVLNDDVIDQDLNIHMAIGDIPFRFMVQHDQGLYYVDTQGYDYLRYAVRID